MPSIVLRGAAGLALAPSLLACRTPPTNETAPPPAEVEWSECRLEPAPGCSFRDDPSAHRSACARGCEDGNADACLRVLEVAPDDSTAWERLEARCQRDPGCGCAMLAHALSLDPTPAAQRRGLELARDSCERGALPGCDVYELVKALCHVEPHGPTCDALRARGELPPEPPPLTSTFGCRRTTGPVGPHAVICPSHDRVSVRDAAGRWDQWPVSSWTRDDTDERVVWVASSTEGPGLLLTPMQDATGASTVHVSGGYGLLHATLETSIDQTATRELAALPSFEDVCRHADACALALQPAPAPTSDHEGPDFEPSDGPRTWRHCYERWSAAAHGALEPFEPPPLPSACGTVDTEGMIPVVHPPFELPGDDGFR